MDGQDGDGLLLFGGGVLAGFFVALLLVILISGNKVSMEYAMQQLDTCLSVGNTIEQCKYLLVK